MVSIQIRALLRYIALGVVLVALKVVPNPPDPIAWALWGALGVLVVSMFFWPRCPHCGARAVQINKREWVPGQFCWRCHRPYDETRTPAYTFALDQAVLEAEKLRKKDPALAERLLHEAEHRFEAAYQADKTSLRERARVDRSAARILSIRLKQELDGLTAGQKWLRKKIDQDPTGRAELEKLEAEMLSIQAELRSLNAQLPFPVKRDDAAV